MGVMLFPSFWLGNASGRGGGGGGGGGGGASFAPHSLFSFRLPPSLLYLSFSLLFSSFFLAPLLSHLLLLLSLSSVPIFFFHYVFLLCPFLFFLRELLVLCALRELFVLYAF